MDSPLRVVLDTNVLISSAIGLRSVPGHVFAHTIRHAQPLLSSTMDDEYRRVLFAPKLDRYVSPGTRQSILSDLLRVALWVDEPPTIQVCRDPKDDMVLALALGGQADVIVSGDNDLLSLNPFRGISILTPREFLTMARERHP